MKLSRQSAKPPRRCGLPLLFSYLVNRTVEDGRDSAFTYGLINKGYPAADARVIHLGQLSQGFVAAVMQRPAKDITADARQRLRAGGGLETVREDAPVRLHPVGPKNWSE